MNELRAVKVSYTVEREVYVYADTDAEARKLARETANWADEDIPSEPIYIRVKREQA